MPLATSPASTHFVSGLAAFGFDESGNEVLEALASRAREFARPMLHRTASPASFPEDLPSALTELFATVDHAHVLVVVDPQQEQHAAVLHAVCSTIQTARKKFQSRIGRAILAVRGRFDPVGRGTNGRVRPLPRRSERRRVAGVDAFDLVVLLDTEKADGSASSTPEDATDTHAVILANLLLSDFEESIYKLLEHQRGPLGFEGLFASFGVAELPFSSQETVRSIVAVLSRRMALRVLHDATAPAPTEVVRGGPWKEEIGDRLAAEHFESTDKFWTDKFHRQGAEKLQRCFQESGYHAGVLLRMLAQREEYLIRFRDSARARLTVFMDEFVPRYVLSPRQEPERVMTSHREYGWTRIAILWLCLVGFAAALLGNSIAGSSTLRVPALLFLALLTGSAMTLLLTRRSRAVSVEPVQVPQAAPQRDVIAELRRYRAGAEIAARILKRHRKLRKSIEADIEALQAELSRPHAPKPAAALSLSDSLIDELLTANGIDAQQVLLEFWEQAEERLASRPAAREKSLFQRLGRYAVSRSAVFSNIRMNDVLGYLGGPAALERPEISREIGRLQMASSPWIPVEGLAAGMIVAIPETLSHELRQSITERFQDPVFVVSTKRESIVALQWTQGYVQGAVDAHTKAMAL